ncbi:MAG: low specificity L-threonine aldolase [Simkania sp.]|nr:low specificity L-threonine aldolase [Simkania sp.]
MHPSHTFASDNFSGIHPEVLQAIQQANTGHAMAYGGDPWTRKVQEMFKMHLGPSAESFVVFNGTGANVCALKQVLSSWQAVICAETAHIWTDECGAPVANVGCSLLTVPTKEGKLQPERMSAFLHHRGVQHHVQPAAIFITQSTELGTLYSIEELQSIAEFARQHGLLFLMDGARICNAAAALNVPLKALTTDVGVDILTFGGTKNGLMGADAIVFLKPQLAEQFQYVRKQQMQLASKMRFLSAQFVALLEKDLWLRNARHSNAMAKVLEDSIRRHCPELSILYPVQVNALFVQLPHVVLKKLQEKQFFWIWDVEKSVARWMTSWDTQPEHIEAFVKELKILLSNNS